jgi:SAM-dependent methyltransferase
MNNVKELPENFLEDKIYFINPDEYNIDNLKKAIANYMFTIDIDVGFMKCLEALFEYYNQKAPLEHVQSLLSDPAQKDRVEWVIQNSRGKILNIGSSSGYLEIYFEDVVSIDISKKRLEFLKTQTKANWLFSISEFLPFKDSTFDTVVLAEVLEHLVNPEIALREIVRVTKNKGRIIITVPDEENSYWARNIEHLHFFTKRKLEELLDKFKLKYTIERRGIVPRLFLCALCEVTK